MEALKGAYHLVVVLIPQHPLKVPLIRVYEELGQEVKVVLMTAAVAFLEDCMMVVVVEVQHLTQIVV